MTPEFSSADLLRIMRSVRIASWIDGAFGPPDEKCGILRGRAHRITRVEQTANVAEDPLTGFEVDPAALFKAYRDARRTRGLEVLGWFHTHPIGDPFPSERDAAMAAPDGRLWVIAARAGLLVWRAVRDGKVNGRFDPVAFDMRVGKRTERGLGGLTWPEPNPGWSVSFEH